jgi:hypothetical protein
MSPFRVGTMAAAAVAAAASLGLWFFGPGLLNVLEVLLARPGSGPPLSLWDPLLAALSGGLYAVSLGLACGAAIAASRTNDNSPRGRAAVAVAGLVMAVGGFALAWAMQQVQSALSNIDTHVSPDDIRDALTGLMPTMQLGLAALCLPPLGLFACGLFGFRPPAAAGGQVRISWLHAIPLAILGLFVVLNFSTAIPEALRWPKLLSGSQPLKPSEAHQPLANSYRLACSAACCCACMGSRW